MTHTTFKSPTHLLAYLAIALLYASPSASIGAEISGKPNFLIFVADDLNKEYFGCYGNRKSASPTVTRLANEGMVFDNAFTGQAICAPSRSMLYTGQYPLKNGAFMNHAGVYKGKRTVCHYLQELNYDVILCGKSHVKPASAFPWTHVMHTDRPAGDKKMFTRPAMPLDQLESYFVKNKQNGRRPFCVIAASHYPHGEHPKSTSFSEQSIALTRFHRDNHENRKSEAQFSQAIKNSDQELKRALTLLDKYDLAENTIVFYVTDHGRFGKWTIYDRGLNVPLIVRWPGGVAAGTRSGALVSFADILPTMLDVAGADPVTDLDGKSLAPILKGTAESHHEYVYGVMTNQGIINAHVFPGRMIRSKRYKYVRNYNTLAAVERREAAGEKHTRFLRMGAEQHPDVPEEELFDVIADLEEKRNLAADPMHREAKAKLKQELQNWMVLQNDFLQDETRMPLLATNKTFRLDVLSHPKNKVELPERLKNSLDRFKFYKHQYNTQYKPEAQARDPER